MDSTGRKALIDARASLDGRGRRFALACVLAGTVAKLFHLVGVDRLFDVHDSRAAAIAALRG